MKRLLCGALAGGMAACLLSGCIPQPKAPTGPGSDGKEHEFPTLPQSVWQPLVRTFEKQARGISNERWKGVFAQFLAKPKTPVEVAIVDLVPYDHEMRSVHSDAVSRVIGSFICEDTSSAACKARVRVSPRPGNGKPGAYDAAGTAPRDDRSLSLRELTDSLSAILGATPAEGRLVINVAVGLDPIKTDVDDPNVKPLIDVLKRASCLGAIVIAPAGNVTGSDGPLIPAAFETLPAPNAKLCAELGAPRVHEIQSPYAPLVYAVGALDGLDQRLPTTRRWGEPRLAAYGLSVSAPGPAAAPYSPPLSGTSMSAAIVSGVAAAVWSTKPELDAHQVMAHVYAGGVPLKPGFESKRAQTEFCLDAALGPCRDSVHRVNLCGALANASGEPPEKLGCLPQIPSKSIERPRWPQEDRPAQSPPPPPCRVSRCGVFAPSAAQEPNGAVPQPYISGCPGCAASIGSARVSGILTWTGQAPIMTSVVVQTFNSNYVQNNPDYPISTWSSDKAFSFGLTPPADTYAAILAVTHDSVTEWIPLIVN